jgi:hypothetical protein
LPASFLILRQPLYFRESIILIEISANRWPSDTKRPVPRSIFGKKITNFTRERVLYWPN